MILNEKCQSQRTVCFHLCGMSRRGKSVGTECRWAVSWGRRGVERLGCNSRGSGIPWWSVNMFSSYVVSVKLCDYTKTVGLCILNGWIVCYVNTISIKLPYAVWKLWCNPTSLMLKCPRCPCCSLDWDRKPRCGLSSTQWNRPATCALSIPFAFMLPTKPVDLWELYHITTPTFNYTVGHIWALL